MEVVYVHLMRITELGKAEGSERFVLHLCPGAWLVRTLAVIGTGLLVLGVVQAAIGTGEPIFWSLFGVGILLASLFGWLVGRGASWRDAEVEVTDSVVRVSAPGQKVREVVLEGRATAELDVFAFQEQEKIGKTNQRVTARALPV